MRIIAGQWAGHALVSPSGRVRPSGEAVRAALMGMVADELEGARVIDLFAGTGALGLEALSRGARRCDFVENGPSAIHSLKANVAALRLRARARVFLRDAIPFVERLPTLAYDLGFADPPYGSRKLDRVLQSWLAIPFCRVLAIEHAPDHAVARAVHSRRIGDSVVSVFHARGTGRRTRE